MLDFKVKRCDSKEPTTKYRPKGIFKKKGTINHAFPAKIDNRIGDDYGKKGTEKDSNHTPE